MYPFMVARSSSKAVLRAAVSFKFRLTTAEKNDVTKLDKVQINQFLNFTSNSLGANVHANLEAEELLVTFVPHSDSWSD